MMTMLKQSSTGFVAPRARPKTLLFLALAVISVYFLATRGAPAGYHVVPWNQDGAAAAPPADRAPEQPAKPAEPPKSEEEKKQEEEKQRQEEEKLKQEREKHEQALRDEFAAEYEAAKRYVLKPSCRQTA